MVGSKFSFALRCLYNFTVFFHKNS